MSENMTEDEVMDSLMAEILDTPQEEIPQEEEVAQAPIQEEIPQEVMPPQEVPPGAIPQNELVPNKTEELLGQLVQQNQELKEALQPREAEPELSEEELALQELADKLGLSEKLAEIDQLKAQLAEQEAFRQQQMQQQQEAMQMQQQAQQAMQVLSKIEKDYGVNETTLANKVDEMIGAGQIPQDRREDPIIWNLVAQNMKAVGQPQQTPDAITSTQSVAPQGKTPTQLKREGKQVDEMDMVAEILRM